MIWCCTCVVNPSRFLVGVALLGGVRYGPTEMEKLTGDCIFIADFGKQELLGAEGVDATAARGSVPIQQQLPLAMMRQARLLKARLAPSRNGMLLLDGNRTGAGRIDAFGAARNLVPEIGDEMQSRSAFHSCGAY